MQDHARTYTLTTLTMTSTSGAPSPLLPSCTAAPAKTMDVGLAEASDTDERVGTADVEQPDGVPPVAINEAHVWHF
jgi:hypothetical protein